MEARQRNLFSDSPGKAVGKQEPQSRVAAGRSAEIRKRRVKVDASAFAGAGFTRGEDSVGLNLFPGVELTAVKQRFERRGARGSAWVGKVSDDPAGSVILVEVGGLVAGSVYAHGKRYVIRGAAAEAQEVVEVDQSAFPPEACDQPPAADQLQPASAPGAVPDAQPDSAARIDVLVVYTPAALARQNDPAYPGDPVGAMNARILLAIEETNASYANSNVATRLNLVHVAPVAYTETKSPTGYQTDLARLRINGDGYMDLVHTLRDEQAADVVVLLVDGLSNYNVCGYGYVAPTASYAFAIVDQNCATGTTYAFGHEIGHLQGARHDRYENPVDGPVYAYNHGHVDLVSRQRTMMAYNNECRDKLTKLNETDPLYCERLLFWSNPNLNYPPSAYYSGSDRPMGTVADENNALVLNNTALTVANFRQKRVTLTVQSTHPASGVTIPVSPASSGGSAGGTTPFQLLYSEGDTVTLTAPATDPAYGLYPLEGWSGCTSVSGDPVPNVCAVTLDADTTVTANYFTPNHLPTLDPIADLTIIEDAGQQTVALAGISDGDGGTQDLLVSASTDNPAFITGLTAPGSMPAGSPSGGSLTFTPAADASGTATITVTVTDNSPAGIYTTTVRTFQVTVSPANDPPTLAALSDRPLLEDAGPQVVGLTGISAGGGESQVLSVAAVSSNTELIPNPTVTYTGGDAGSLSFAPLSNKSGSATITVTVNDGQATNNTSVRVFLVTVSAVNDPPTLNAILPPSGVRTISEGAGLQLVSLSGISAGGGETQVLSVTVSSSDTALIPMPAVSYKSPGATGSLSFTPVKDAFGSAEITVTVGDGETSVSRTFQVLVNGVNDPPQIDPILLPPGCSAWCVNRDAGVQTVPLTGITAGPGGESQTLTVTASSSNTALISNDSKDPDHLQVTYAGGSTGSLTFKPKAGKYGSATITVRVSDGALATVRSFSVVVNDPPTLDDPADMVIAEDPGLQTVPLSGIAASADGLERQTLTVTASSSNTALIPKPSVSYLSPRSTGSLRFTPVANASGTATITVRVSDGQAANGFVEQSFTVTVDPVNDAPTLNAIANRTVNEDAGWQTVPLSGITAGGGESQTLEVTAASSNAALIPNDADHLKVTHAGGTTGTLSYRPLENAYGTATISVVVNDGQAANGTRTRTFVVTVRAVNDKPTLEDTPDMTIAEDAGLQTVPLTGISAGGGESQTLKVTASSSNTALIPTPAVSYVSASATGTLSFTPVANASGTATITVRVSDGQTLNSAVIQTFLVTVTAVNDPPTLNALAARVLGKNAGLQTVFLSGVGAGPKESQKPLTVTASSSNTALIPNPTVSYTSPYSTGILRFTPTPNAFGSATITVTVNDGQASNNTFSQPFTVTVNDPPTLAAIANQIIAEDSGLKTVDLGGITAGSGESQSLAVTAHSSNPQLIPDPAVSYASPSEVGSLSFAPAPDKSGSATVTVTVNDGQAGRSVFSRAFLVTVQAVNDPPTLDAIPSLELDEGAGQQTVPLSGITAGPGENQGLVVTVSSSNPQLIPNPTVSYVSPAATGSLRFTPVAGATGTATVAVKVHEGLTPGSSVTQYFAVTVSAPAPDAPPPSLRASFVGIVGGVASQNPAGPAPLAVTFDAGASGGPNPIVAYRWDFGDRQAAETAAETVAHGYGATGSYFVTLTVIDSSGATNATQTLVTVAEEVQTASSSAELQAALSIAAANGRHDIVRLAGGVYALSANAGVRFVHSSTEGCDLVVEGGWTPDFGQRGANIPTRLVSDLLTPAGGSGGVLEIAAGGSVALDGLEVSGGAADGNGGGLSISSPGPIAVTDCRLLNNTAGGAGGGLYLESTGGHVLLHGTTIRGNGAASGGGAAIRAFSVSVSANEIADNSAGVSDGGLQASVPSGGELVVSSNTIFGNQSAGGASGLAVGATGTSGVSLLDVRNTIVFGNGPAPDFAVAADCDYAASQLSLSIASNDIGSYGLCPAYPLDDSNVSVDFSGRAAGDARLTAADAALIDAGAALAHPAADVEGDTPPLDGDGDGSALPDIGADEYNPGNVGGPTALTVAADGTIAAAGGSAMLTVTLDHPAKRDLVFSLGSSDTALVTLPSAYLKVFKGQRTGRAPAQAATGASGGAAMITVSDPSGRIAPGSAVVTVAGGT